MPLPTWTRHPYLVSAWKWWFNRLEGQERFDCPEKLCNVSKTSQIVWYFQWLSEGIVHLTCDFFWSEEHSWYRATSFFRNKDIAECDWHDSQTAIALEMDQFWPEYRQTTPVITWQMGSLFQSQIQTRRVKTHLKKPGKRETSLERDVLFYLFDSLNVFLFFPR